MMHLDLQFLSLVHLQQLDIYGSVFLFQNHQFCDWVSVGTWTVQLNPGLDLDLNSSIYLILGSNFSNIFWQSVTWKTGKSTIWVRWWWKMLIQNQDFSSFASDYDMVLFSQRNFPQHTVNHSWTTRPGRVFTTNRCNRGGRRRCANESFEKTQGLKEVKIDTVYICIWYIPDNLYLPTKWPTYVGKYTIDIIRLFGKAHFSH